MLITLQKFKGGGEAQRVSMTQDKEKLGDVAIRPLLTFKKTVVS